MNCIGQRLAEAVTGRCTHGIDQAHGWWFRATGTAWQMNELVVAVAAMLQYFESWCRGTENDRNVELFGADYCEVPGRIAKTLLLFEGRIVLFIDNDQPGVSERCEDR